jgi:hypothetical protein
VHSVGDAHVTASRPLLPGDGGAGTGSIVHAPPSHRSARGTTTPDGSSTYPTAMQLAGDEHDTPAILVLIDAAGLAAR